MNVTNMICDLDLFMLLVIALYVTYNIFNISFIYLVLSNLHIVSSIIAMS